MLANLGFDSPYLGPVFDPPLPVNRRSRVMNSVRVCGQVFTYEPRWSKKFFIWTWLRKEHVLRSCKTRDVELKTLLLKINCITISVCRKLCNPWHSFLRLPHVPFVWGIRKFNPTAPQLPKIEAIQTSLFVDVLNAFPAMTGPLPAAIRSRIVRLLLLHWQPPAIAEEVHCCPRTVYSIRENIFMYSSPFKPQFRPKGGPPQGV